VKLEFDAEMLALIPVGIALWFMIWVLWNWRKEERRKHVRSHADLPETNIARTCDLAMSRSDANLRRSQQLVSSAASQRLQRPAGFETR
jgi:hypothetical protein